MYTCNNKSTIVGGKRDLVDGLKPETNDYETDRYRDKSIDDNDNSRSSVFRRERVKRWAFTCHT